MFVLPKKLVIGAFVAVIATTGIVQAKSFTELMEQGYKIGKLTTGKSGMPGWVASNGTKQYFCRMRLGLAYVGTRGPDPTIPLKEDLEAGRVRPIDVDFCLPAQ
ncbi:hypothetical protein [Pleomorphomonas oryzae]|uniref:hypothetical protein n=1 Tax=Pleomorphomonas oryzae TaxID=261934 RepID=UPI000429A48E|nr:hypothetical protein [Pleomorphomonas oryzae]